MEGVGFLWMRSWIALFRVPQGNWLCLALFVSLGVSSPAFAKENITVGYLTITTYESKYIPKMQGKIISGAMKAAVVKINRHPKLLPNHTLQFMWADTKGQTSKGIRELTEQWKQGAVAFIGPEDSCDVEARVAAAWNLPMISYKCADYKVSDKKLYPTFARTFPPATQVTYSVFSLLTKYSWRKFSLVVGSSSPWKSIADQLEKLALEHNYTVNGRFNFKMPYVSKSTDRTFHGIVQQSYVDTRVYVYLGNHNGMIDMLLAMEARGLLDSGEYIVIYVDFSVMFDPVKYFRRTYDPPNQNRTLEAARSLLVLVISPPSNPNYSKFHKAVDLFNERKPFNFPNPFHISKSITVYAAYLYDAVWLYARALDEVLREGGTIYDGKKIIDKIRGHTYKSIQGFDCYIDDNGDAIGNYTLLARASFQHLYGEYGMLPAGNFQIRQNKSFPNEQNQSLAEFHLFENKTIEWVGGVPPLDEPRCGYRNQHCIPKPNYTLQIVLGVLGGIVFITFCVLLGIYRQWRLRQEIEGLLWKININDIQLLNSGHSVIFGSKVTLTTIGSFDSRCSLAQIFTKTGTYKGQLVALKKYTKRNFDLSSKMKKEMKLMRDLHHDNVNAFVGACVDPPNFIVVTEYCAKGSLQDILENEDLKLDSMFIASLVMDLVKGMIFLHDSELQSHGNLKSSNCVVNSRWTLQVADYGLYDLRSAETEDNEHAFFRNKFWTAPELIRSRNPPQRGTQSGDTYSFGIILYEIMTRAGPYSDTDLSPKDIIYRIANPKDADLFRPKTSCLDCQDWLKQLIEDCWLESPDSRPDFRMIRTGLKPMRQGMKSNIMDNMIEMMEKYQLHLEDLVADRTEQLIEEKRKTEGLLHRMLPRSVADQLIRGKSVTPEAFTSTTIYFSDICGFTALSAISTPMQVVDMLNDLYTHFDSIIRNYDVYKVETIGDAYMVVSGLPIKNGDNHAGEIASMSLHLLRAIKSFKITHLPEEVLKLRIGIHTGPVVAGVVGLTMPRFCLFGDTVNTSSRMESNGEPLRIHVSEECQRVLRILGGYILEERGYVNMKGKGKVFTYWLVDEVASVRTHRMSAFMEQQNLMERTDTLQRTRSCREHDNRPSSRSNINNSSTDSPGKIQRRSVSYDKGPLEGSFYELMSHDPEDKKTSKLPRGHSFRRRRSLNDARLHGRDQRTANGSVIRALDAVAGSTLDDCEETDGDILPQSGDYIQLPTIVVDSSTKDDINVPVETDRLLGPDPSCPTIPERSSTHASSSSLPDYVNSPTHDTKEDKEAEQLCCLNNYDNSRFHMM